MNLREVLTIGHSTHRIEKFIELLRQHEVTAVADVRSAPFSRYNPQFNKEALAAELKRNGIAYVFLGKELGARSNDPSCYEDGRVRYGWLAKTEAFHAGLERVRTGAEMNRIALMCAEKEPLECHRTLLVARSLAESGMTVTHILSDGQLESHEAAMTRLLDVVGLPREDLFRGREELISEALERQEKRVAYVDEKLATEAAGESP
jgi:uncharacterized protein (DUF488 family)